MARLNVRRERGACSSDGLEKAFDAGGLLSRPLVRNGGERTTRDGSGRRLEGERAKPLQVSWSASGDQSRAHLTRPSETRFYAAASIARPAAKRDGRWRSVPA